MREFIQKNSATGIRLEKFGLAITASPPLLSRAKQLIFLCGANQTEEKPSVRRATVKKFVQSISSAFTVLYAEGIFNELKKFEKHNKNVLDLEHEISQISDKVIIILESASAFCELGAFAHNELRHKLIIINNSQFRESTSFINIGPIAAAREAKSPTLWYPMSHDGVSSLDGIGAVFPALREALDHKSSAGVRVPYEDLENLSLTKACLYFIHDLVLFCGPVKHEEIVYVLKVIFGDKSFDPLKNILGVLRAGELVSTRQISPNEWVYQAETPEPFLKYETDTNALLSSFRSFHLKNNPVRFGYA